MSTDSLADLISLRKIASTDTSRHEFVAVHNPRRMGNALNIAYGGFSLAAVVKSAFHTVPEGYHLYSLLGHFHGPALTDRPLHCSVSTIRQTRTFATRNVEISQTQDNGEKRLCMVALADFQVKEKGSIFKYSSPPSRSYTEPENLEPKKVQEEKILSEGTIPRALIDAHKKSFATLDQFFDLWPCPEGIFAQNLTGMAKSVQTTQEHLPITEKSTADWIRTREALSAESDQLATLAFLADGAIAFAPLSFSHMFLDDAAACSSLDFAFRMFSNEVNLNEWHLREIQTTTGGEGRTYSEARIWDRNGDMVVSMTQQGIMRKKQEKNARL